MKIKYTAVIEGIMEVEDGSSQEMINVLAYEKIAEDMYLGCGEIVDFQIEEI